MVRSSFVHSVIASLLAACASAATSQDWSTRSIYFVLTDRFAKTSSDSTACGDLSNYCGGTWKGMESKLDYIKSLGFDSIWITPFVKNSDGGYHGYWAQNIYEVNDHHGTSDDLKSLVATAHSKGMHIMADVVVNHMGQGAYESFTPFNNEGYFHPYCLIDYNNQTSIEVCRIDKELPDIRTEDPNIRKIFQDWIADSIKTYGFDGLRIDTVKHVEKDFFPPFVSAANVYAVGEVFQGDPNYDAPYQQVMPGLLNYPLYYTIQNAFVSKQSMKGIAGGLDAISAAFQHPEYLGNFIDNHDNPRFLHSQPDTALLKNALGLAMLSRGIPIVYGGTEQAYGGGNDPANREDLWRSSYSQSGEIFTFLQKVMQAKRSGGGLGGNDHVHLLTSSDSEYAFSRANGKVVVLLTNRGKGQSADNICFKTPASQGTVYSSALSPAKYTAGQNGQICVNLSDGQPEILLSSS